MNTILDKETDLRNSEYAEQTKIGKSRYCTTGKNHTVTDLLFSEEDHR